MRPNRSTKVEIPCTRFRLFSYFCISDPCRSGLSDCQKFVTQSKKSLQYVNERRVTVTTEFAVVLAQSRGRTNLLRKVLILTVFHQVVSEFFRNSSVADESSTFFSQHFSSSPASVNCILHRFCVISPFVSYGSIDFRGLSRWTSNFDVKMLFDELRTRGVESVLRPSADNESFWFCHQPKQIPDSE